MERRIRGGAAGTLFEEGDGLIVRVAKRGNGDWDTFLVDEVPAPTASYRGVCEATGASTNRTSTEMRIEVALPDHVEARDVNVAVAGDAWSVEAGAWSLGGALMGAVRADDTARLVDDGGLPDADEAGRGAWWTGADRVDLACVIVCLSSPTCARCVCACSPLDGWKAARLASVLGGRVTRVDGPAGCDSASRRPRRLSALSQAWRDAVVSLGMTCLMFVLRC